MYPFFEFLGRRIPAYGASGAVGFLLSLLYVYLRSKKLNISSTSSYIYVTGAICAMIGAKVLYLITAVPEIAAAFRADYPAVEIIRAYFSGGMIFYGGLAGAVCGAYFASRWYGRHLSEFLRVFMPAICIFHGFGRIGCFLAGCCYGKPTESPIGVIFSHSDFAPKGVPVIPVQLIEAAGLFILFLVLHVYSGKCKNDLNMFVIYAAVYAPFRFLIEFLRGDAERKFLGPLSTSQWLSTLFLVITLIYVYKNRKKVQA